MIQKLALFSALFLIANPAFAEITVDQIKAFSQNLAAGQYSGQNGWGEVCHVTVSAAADGSIYTVSITLLSGKGKPGVASVTIMPSDEGFVEKARAGVSNFDRHQEISFSNYTTAFQVDVVNRTGDTPLVVGDCYIR